MSWADDQLLGLDLETTGVDVETARLVTGCLAICPPCRKGAKETPEVFEWLADPGIDIPTEASDVHGITTEYAREHGRPEREVVTEMLEWLTERWNPTTPLVIYNSPYDISVIDRRARAHNLVGSRGVPILGPILDPLVIDRTHPKTKFRKAGKGGRKLTKVSAHYGCPISQEDAHNATADTLAAVRVARAIGRRLPDVGRATPRALYVRQVNAQRLWAPDMQAYLRRLNAKRDHDDPERVDPESIVLSPHWPLIPYVDTATEAS